MNVRKDFSVLKKGVVYLDSACVTLMPDKVLKKLNEYYKEYPGCGVRSSHKFGRILDEKVFNVREQVKKFLNFKGSIIFGKNTTEMINLVANSVQGKVLISSKEHNSNFVPWVNRCDVFNNMDEFYAKLNKDVKLISVYHKSNLDGSVLDVKEIVKAAKKNGSLVLIDGAQAVGSLEVDLSDINCDFYVFSGHKCFSGFLGILCVKDLGLLKPLTVGGGGVFDVGISDYSIIEGVLGFEAGIQNYASIISLGEGLKYINRLGDVSKHINRLTDYVKLHLDVNFIGCCNGIISFNIENVNCYDIVMYLDSKYNILVRGGLLCCDYWFGVNNLEGCVRVSVSVYNTLEEMKLLVKAIEDVIEIFGKK